MNKFISNKENRTYVLVFLLLIASYIIACIAIIKFKNTKIEELTAHIIQIQEQALNATYDKYKTLSKMVFDTHLNTPEVHNILKNGSDDTDKTREKLYNLLQPTYATLKNYNIGQIQFHSHTNSSFLRMQNPTKYGDSLSKFRYSVNLVNDSCKPFESFEIGTYMYGYRFVYPIQVNNRCVGSTEVGVSITAFLQSFMSLYENNVFFLLSKKTADLILDKNKKTDFVVSSLDDFYFINHKTNNDALQNLTKDELKHINTEINKGVPFTFLTKDNILSFIPIKNHFTHNIDGVYFLYSSNDQIKSTNHSFAFLLMFITVVLFFILYMLYRFKKFKISLLQKTIDIKKILDNQEAIVVVTDRKDIKEANQKFFDFVGLKNIQEFKNNHLCICEFFEYEEGENYIQAQMDTLLWNEYLLQYKDEIHYVKMSGIDKVKHIFQISISDFEEYQIINFYDITKQKELEKQLNDMNKNLEIHIADEIEKSRKKDIVIQQQIRLAQMGEMISMIAHQWRQPLASISSSIVTVKLKFILKKYDLESNEGKELFLAYLNSELDDIESVVEGLTTTIDNFRNFYKTTDEIEEVYIDDILQKAVGSINIEYSNGDLDIVESYHSKKIISVYKNEIFQVLFNILINSIENFNEKYIEHRLIKIESEDLDGIIQIKITDNGGGIPMDIIDKIFDPYFSTKNNKNDTGLGLYTSKITIERNHRGKLTVQNTSDGVCFCITLHL